MSSIKSTLVLCLSTESIKSDIWTNKQHLMSRLSTREGYEVIYVDQGMSTRELSSAFKNKDWTYFFKPIWKYNEKMTCFSFYFLPLIKGGIFKRVSWRLLYYYLFYEWIDKREHDQILIWTYQPQSWYFIDKINKNSDEILIVYDCVDDFKSQPFYSKSNKRKKELLKIEQNLIEVADVVITTSLKLYEDKKKLNKSTHYVHNVGDFEHFKKPVKSLPESLSFLASIKKKKIAYAGVIDDYKIDLELIDKVTEGDLFFLFLGPIRIQKKLRLFRQIESKDNVLFYGYLDYSMLPSVLHACDAIWLPYQKNDHTQYVFPLKLFEAFATGKQVVARALESYKKYYSYMQVFEDAEQALNELKKEPNEQIAIKRQNLAKKNSWESRLNKILDIINI